ncbi:transmembrane emp24 domain-containing protein 6-like protein [Dinothrombium tinctorium]|uniref:Transmembrane emp24 domain-containing protein 6-like protein n=1 Tax=Dinothrombium tinctorium TaxID=1965070 RepID=A0A3S3P5S3_9ACAR|nr:transmembrane emp24 domain-containing protein 6-like protein [Dinothrombium tinctorium]
MRLPQRMAKHALQIVLILICFSHLNLVRCDSIAGGDRSDSLGFAFEFKIHVDAGKEECFYQYVQQQSTLYVAFQASSLPLIYSFVMKGGDGMVGFSIRNPTGVLVLPHTWEASKDYEENSVAIPGYYELCIDNTFSRFAPKLVSFYMASYKREEWEKYIDELTSADVTVANFTSSIQNVDKNIATILRYMEQSRRHITHDWYLVEGNNRYVQNWSLAQCLVIILSSVIQAYFLKSLFSVDGGQKGKPRA